MENAIYRPHFFTLVLALVVAAADSGLAQEKGSGSLPEPMGTVWAREVESWRLGAAGDVESYLSFFHPDFVGWPCGPMYPRPARKNTGTLGDWVHHIRDTGAEFRSELRREAIQQFGSDIVVVVSSTPIQIRYPDGSTARLLGRYKITHTWIRSGDTWLAISGMCGLPEEQVR